MIEIKAVQELITFFKSLAGHDRETRKLFLTLLQKHFNLFKDDLLAQLGAGTAPPDHHEPDERPMDAETGPFSRHHDALLSDPYAEVDTDLRQLQTIIDLLRLEERELLNAMMLREVLDRPMAFRDEEDFY